MDIIISGDDWDDVIAAIKLSGLEITSVVYGCDRDNLGERYARIHNLPVREVPAVWSKPNPLVAHCENMARVADAAIISGELTPRREHLISQMKGKPCFISL